MLDPRGRYPESRSPGERGGQADSRHTPSGLPPWFGVWIHPRLVARDFIYSSKPLRGALLLALLAGRENFTSLTPNLEGSAVRSLLYLGVLLLIMIAVVTAVALVSGTALGA
ncbi:hypothetical protein [Saccharibacillus deserti]|uniref:hypothetical protein n=1 Tax=Saccharibacillus deserti TaxID=1634444 RepID=UPI001553F856|nr:hypothetical protein [Saccharibacillus deserti]